MLTSSFFLINIMCTHLLLQLVHDVHIVLLVGVQQHSCLDDQALWMLLKTHDDNSVEEFAKLVPL